MRFTYEGKQYEVDLDFYVHYKARQIKLPDGRFVLPIDWTAEKEPFNIVEMKDRTRQSGIYAMEATPC